ncbi:TetR/AcrR family transcriptional regulator [Rhodococcus oxybenzonivorans]|uniref:TetR/AcrR family transcriptional regulator n=1 Tax=Rhodococcus oxybenzonivorans TaxID=1990687 RepID=UPI002954DA83|nr:TetR/AcrR family transcriptional regulator [Rhodococcus oxybenzonivorans]MDV7353870.1 TetR/AcrR family transcriptional regulator [Rhodococcus oxybenzonivorans]
MTADTSGAGRYEEARAVHENDVVADRCALIEAAGRCFAELGYDKTTEAVIAENAGRSVTDFRRHFRSTKDAFHAVAAAVFEKFLEAQRTAVPPDADPRTVLGAATAAFIDTVYSVGRLFTVIEARAAVDPVVGEQLSQAHTRILARYTRFIEGLDEAGIARPCAEAAQLARKLSDAQWRGAAHLIGASPDEQRRFIVEMTAAAERFIGFDCDTELVERPAC